MKSSLALFISFVVWAATPKAKIAIVTVTRNTLARHPHVFLAWIIATHDRDAVGCLGGRR
ncbi:hypothetical protein [Synechococcus sp. KORDI-100]|uniref:hypothetical protein n=1 Tax=Synechococcus sp. KORDI-100 TaxID=1280380 RepID=UPI0012E09206|nr:hypothetical protein [Synechococcus sp. KORDI-100]